MKPRNLPIVHRLKKEFIEPANIERLVYSNTKQAQKALKKNKAVKAELTKTMNRARSQCYIQSIQETRIKVTLVTSYQLYFIEKASVHARNQRHQR